MTETQLNPYLRFDGDARAAMEFYRDVLGGTLDMQTLGDSGQSDDEATKDRIMHAHLDADGITLMASDSMPGQPPLVPGDNVSLSLVGSDAEGLTKIFEALAEGGTVVVQLEEQFWGDTFGMLTDRFGMQWMVNVSKS